LNIHQTSWRLVMDAPIDSMTWALAVGGNAGAAASPAPGHFPSAAPGAFSFSGLVGVEDVTVGADEDDTGR
jgi:hypothetical protein